MTEKKKKKVRSQDRVLYDNFEVVNVWEGKRMGAGKEHKGLKGQIKEEEVQYEKEGEISDRLSEERKTIMNKLGG